MTTDQFQTFSNAVCTGSCTADELSTTIIVPTKRVIDGIDYLAGIQAISSTPPVNVKLAKPCLPVYGLPLFLAQQVSDVQVYNNRVVKLTFSDDTVTTAVCSDSDVFSLEVGISVCLMKRMMADDQKKGSSLYNKAIKTILDKYKKQQDKILEEKAEEKRRKQKWEKARKKKELRRKRKEEHAIEIQKEAYLRAMQEMKDSQS